MVHKLGPTLQFRQKSISRMSSLSHHLGWLTSDRKDFKITNPKLAITTVLSAGLGQSEYDYKGFRTRAVYITEVNEDVCTYEGITFTLLQMFLMYSKDKTFKGIGHPNSATDWLIRPHARVRSSTMASNPPKTLDSFHLTQVKHGLCSRWSTNPRVASFTLPSMKALCLPPATRTPSPPPSKPVSPL